MSKRWQCKDIPDALVLQAAADKSRHNGLLTGSKVVTLTGAPPKVVLAKIIKLVDRRLLDYGTSPWSAFLTPDGEAALAEGRVA